MDNVWIVAGCGLVGVLVGAGVVLAVARREGVGAAKGLGGVPVVQNGFGVGDVVPNGLLVVVGANGLGVAGVGIPNGLGAGGLSTPKDVVMSAVLTTLPNVAVFS